MKERLSLVFAVSATVVASFGAALVAEDYISPIVASTALVITLFAATLTAWMGPE